MKLVMTTRFGYCATKSHGRMAVVEVGRQDFVPAFRACYPAPVAEPGIATSACAVFAGAIGASATQPDAARSLLRFLGSPDAVRVMSAKGLEPPA
jgi:ABC-type glycerol-3-phosphate transport system substrate-binding protein